MSCSRREFLKISFAALAAGSMPLPALAAVAQSDADVRQLSFYNTHTRETLDVCYYEKGRYCPKALARVNRILRDHRTSEIQSMDPRLFDALFAVRSRLRPQTPFHIISGFRSAATNAMLRKQSRGVARTSFHTKGQAIDIRLPGIDIRRLRDCCRSLKSGGVGYYPDSGFVHLDTGPVRSW